MKPLLIVFAASVLIVGVIAYAQKSKSAELAGVDHKSDHRCFSGDKGTHSISCLKQGFDLQMEWLLSAEVVLYQDNTLELYFTSSKESEEIKIELQPTTGIDLLGDSERVLLKDNRFKEKVSLRVSTPGRHYISVIATTNKNGHQVFKTFSIPVHFGNTSKKKSKATLDANGKRIISLKAETKIK